MDASVQDIFQIIVYNCWSDGIRKTKESNLLHSFTFLIDLLLYDDTLIIDYTINLLNVHKIKLKD
jgi:hypothetical protein